MPDQEASLENPCSRGAHPASGIQASRPAQLEHSWAPCSKGVLAVTLESLGTCLQNHPAAEPSLRPCLILNIASALLRQGAQLVTRRGGTENPLQPHLLRDPGQ